MCYRLVEHSVCESWTVCGLLPHLFVMLSCHHFLFCRSIYLPKQELLAWTHTAMSSGRRMSSGREIKFRLQSCFFFSPVANHLVLCFLCCVVTRSGWLMMGQLLVCIALSPETLFMCLCVTGLWSTVCARVEPSVDFSLIWLHLNFLKNGSKDFLVLPSINYINVVVCLLCVVCL